MVFGSFAPLFTTKSCFSHNVLTEGIKFRGVIGLLAHLCRGSVIFHAFCLHTARPAPWKRLKPILPSAASWAAVAFPRIAKKLFHQNAQSCQHQRRQQTRISHTSPSQKRSMVHTLTARCDVSYELGRVGKISALTDIPLGWCQRYVAKYVQYDVSNQNMNPQATWELICLGQGGPQRANPEVRIITPEVESPLRLLQENTAKARGGSRNLAGQTRGGVWSSASLAMGPHSRHSTLWQGHLQRTDVLLATCVAEWGDLWSHCLHLQTHCGLICSESPWVTAAFVLLQVTKSLFRLLIFKRGRDNIRYRGRSGPKFQGQVITGRKTTTLCKHWPSIKPLKLEFITNATVAHRVNKQLSVWHNRTRWTDKLSVCLQPVQPIKWGYTGTFLLGSWMPNASLAPSVSHITLILLPGKNFQFYLYPLKYQKKEESFFCLKRQ